MEAGIAALLLAATHFPRRIPLKQAAPVRPSLIPTGRSRQKMVADIIRQPAGRSQSVPARPPFTSFSLPATPSPTKKCEFGLA